MVASVVGLTVGFLMVAGLERVERLRFAPSRFLRPHLATDAAWYVVAVGSSALTAAIVRPYLADVRLVGVIADLPTTAQLVLAVVAYDAVAFSVHRIIHRSNALWAVHQVHHSSLQLDWLATTRTHLGEHAVRNLPAQLLLLAAGVPVPTLTAAAGVYAAFALLGHSNLGIDLRWAERVFVTPRLHRIHHVPATTQRNFGTVLSVWDRLAGTLTVADLPADVLFGVPGEVDTYPQRFPDAVREPFRRVVRSTA